MAAINPGWPNRAEPFLEGLSSSFFGPRQEQRPLGRGTKKVADSELAGEWAETEVLVKCLGAHKETSEVSWKESLRVQNLVKEGARKTLLLASIPLTSPLGIFTLWRF